MLTVCSSYYGAYFVEKNAKVPYVAVVINGVAFEFSDISLNPTYFGEEPGLGVYLSGIQVGSSVAILGDTFM